MSQHSFPEIDAAAQALERRISITESEIAQMKAQITEKKRLIKGLKKAISAVSPKPSKPKEGAASA